MVSVVSRLERPHSAKNERSRAQINGQAGRNPLSEALKCFGFNARGKRYCQPRLDYIGLASSGRRCLIRTSMIRKHFTGARIPRRRNAYVGKPCQNNLPICLLTRGYTCVCKKHTGWRRRAHIRIERVLIHRMCEIAPLPMGFGASQASRGDARRTCPALQIKPARAIQIAPDGLLNRLFARTAGKTRRRTRPLLASYSAATGSRRRSATQVSTDSTAPSGHSSRHRPQSTHTSGSTTHRP